MTTDHLKTGVELTSKVSCMRGTQKFPELLKNFIFKIVVQVGNFSPLQRTAPVTGCSNLSASPIAGNTVQRLQRKCCRGPPAILIEPPQCQQNTPPNLPDHAPCDLFGSHGWSRIWREGNLLTLERLIENSWWPLTTFQLKILDIVSSSGSSTGIAAASHRGSTSKGIKVSN